jgi:hypothetical protein
MAIEHHITSDDHMFVGDDRLIEIRVYEDHDEQVPLDVNGHSLVWILKTTDKSSTVLIEKSTDGSPPGIVVTGTFDADPSLNQQKVVVTLGADDSYSQASPAGVRLSQKKYRYALKRVNDGARSTLMYGNFQWLYATTVPA